MKIPNHVLTYRYHFFRGKLVQPAFWALVFLAPALDIFRVDMLNQKLVFLGKHLPFAFNSLLWLPVGFYGAVILIGIVSFIWGRLFCGWACPHNTLTEWTRAIRGAVGRDQKPAWMKRLIRKYPASKTWLAGLSLTVGLGLCVTLSILLCFYVMPPDFVLSQYAGGKPHIALVWGNGLFTLIGLFLLFAGSDFCRTCCPYGMAQSVSAYHENSRWRPMEIGFSGSLEADCKTCQACQMVCPVDIDPRAGTLTGQAKVGQFDGCFNCGECIDACKYLHSFKETAGLLSFKNPGFKPNNAEEHA